MCIYIYIVYNVKHVYWNYIRITREFHLFLHPFGDTSHQVPLGAMLSLFQQFLQRASGSSAFLSG